MCYQHQNNVENYRFRLKRRFALNSEGGNYISLEWKSPFPGPYIKHWSWWESSTIPHASQVAIVRLIPKAKAQDHPADPANFRPIALTSCVGKVFTTIMKNICHLMGTLITAFKRLSYHLYQVALSITASLQQQYMKHKTSTSLCLSAG